MRKIAVLLISIFLTACTTGSPTITVSPSTTYSSEPNITYSPTAITVSPSIQNSVKIALVDPIGEPGPNTFGCGDRIVMVNRNISTTTPLQTALEELFSVRPRDYGQSGYITALDDQNFHITRVAIVEGTATIEITGTIRFGGTCDVPRVEEQIKQTIKQFSSVQNYRILLNDSERNWQCLFQTKDDC